MGTRTYPSYWLYKDAKKEWRWRYDASNGQTIAVSSESYKKRSDCERGIQIMRESSASQTWFPSELTNAA